MEQERCTSAFFSANASVLLNDTSGKYSDPVLVMEPQKSVYSESSTANSSQENCNQNLSDSDVETLHLWQLDTQEREPFVIPHFFNLSPRTMPLSPHYVFEEEFSNNPWILLVATIFLTKTSGKTARPFMRSFFGEFPTPYHVLDADPSSLEKFFESLGLRKRGRMIWKMSYQFVSARWRRASDLCGVGKYGEDAYRIFCLGHTDVEPADRYLRLYVDWLRGHTEFLERGGVEDCEHVIEDPVMKYYTLTLKDFVRNVGLARSSKGAL